MVRLLCEALHRILGHGVVDVSGGSGDPGSGIASQVEVRVHGNAMPADGDAWLMDVAERLAVAGLDDLVDVDAVVIGMTRELVGEADVDVAVRRSRPIWRALPLRCYRGSTRRWVAPDRRAVELQHGFVEPDCQLGAGLVDPADQFRVAGRSANTRPE